MPLEFKECITFICNFLKYEKKSEMETGLQFESSSYINCESSVVGLFLDDRNI
jgi:hypothetical protein